ncbi:MAG: geranylgeranyl reductase family protein [Candidatus Aenigmarchaeota archaeon]|nr:geranylgeranyl reductase family protein [Candidatus Aenigmarchaeota archaeon]
MFDFTICGAGPIGSFLAWKLSLRGYKVLLIEEHPKPGLPLACSGLISKRIFTFVPYNKSLIERQIHGARIHVKNKTFTFKSSQPLVFNRTKLDQYIFDIARNSGVEMMLSTKLFSFFERDDLVTLYIKRNGKLMTLQTKILIGCDGPLSTVRSQLNIPQPKFLHGIFTYSSGSLDDFVDLYLKESPDFFAWRIPRYSLVEYGIASSHHTKTFFQKFLKKHKIKPTKIYSGLIPFGLLPRISSHRVLLCGDAASMTKPHTGGGVIYGLTCADIASRVIDPDDPNLSFVESLIKKKLKKEILTGLFIKNSYRLPTPFLSLALSILSKRRDLDMDKPSTIFNI